MTEIPPVVDLSAERRAVDAALAVVCERAVDHLPARVADAVRYSLRGPGKRLRGILVAYTYRAAGGTGDPAALAAAVEVVHAYSLVHDDLPCMDDDDLRRGRPTTHIVYGNGIAMTDGLVMVPLTARCVAAASASLALEGRTAAIIVETLMHAAGAAGMIGGQLMDLRAEGELLPIDALEAIHRAKTGALIAAAAKIGGIAAGAGDEAVRALGRYGDDLGLAFQIVDDVLDVTATSAQLGKAVGRDVMLGKSTYPSLLGVQGATARAQALAQDGCAALRDAGLLTPELRHVADLVITRTH
jgi:geranylgeranyl pyrophosphate synthase